MRTKQSRYFFEFLTIALLIFFLIPLMLVVINAAKSNNEILTNPISMPENWGNIWANITTIWNNPNIRYGQALFNSVFITFFSLMGITISSAMAAWVLVRTKTKTSMFIFMVFVAAMVIPFQVVMFPLVRWFSIVQRTIGIPLLRNYT